jgi:hypothetical protein
MMMFDGIVIDPLIDHSISSSESEIVSLLILVRKERLRKKKRGAFSMAVKIDRVRDRDLLLFFSGCRGWLFVLLTCNTLPRRPTLVSSTGTP